MSASVLTFDIVPKGPDPLGAEVWFDEQCLLDQDQVTAECKIIHQLNDDVAQSHVVKIVLKNKTPEHTVLDDDLKIVKDSVLEVKNFKIDSIDIDYQVQQYAMYTHTFNSNTEPIADKFYNTLGCNGTVTFAFSTPAYIWLLEHM